MKTIDFKQYNEKLKINPMSLDDFDKVNVFNKKIIENYDIVKLKNDNYYMAVKVEGFKVFDNYDLNKMLILAEKYGEGGFLLSKIDEFNHASYLFLNDYYNDEKHYADDDFDIVALWKAPNNIKFKHFYDDRFNKQSMPDIIEKYHYKLVFKKENFNKETNEKLKINPIGLNDFDKIDTSIKIDYLTYYSKDKLKTGDVCQIRNGDIGVIIMGGDVDLEVYHAYVWNGRSVLMIYKGHDKEDWMAIPFSEFAENLENKNHFKLWDVLKIVPNAINIETVKDPNKTSIELKRIAKHLK